MAHVSFAPTVLITCPASSQLLTKAQYVLRKEPSFWIVGAMLIQLASFRPFASYQQETICLRCLRRLTRSQPANRRPFAANNLRRNAAVLSRRGSAGLAREHFWANNIDGLKRSKEPIDRRSVAAVSGVGSGDFRETPSKGSKATVDTNGVATPGTEQERPHRRRRRKAEQISPEDPRNDSESIPPDASSRLTTASAAAPPSSLRRRLALYLSLSKPRLTFLVVLTAATPYGLYPTPEILSPISTATPSLSAATLLFLTIGTSLASASANTFNMLAEPQYDARMSRTCNRPLVRKLISPRAAALFGVLTGITGVAVLYFGCNSTTSLLGGANIVLYAAVYTPLKRISVVNTWVGALVGAIPPLMGWTAAAGQYTTEDGWRGLLFTPQAEGGWLLAALLFAWQFPHFNALSHTIREEYANAGYKMLCSANPARNARVALRYSLLMFPICIGLAASGVVGGPSLTAPTTVLWAAGSTAVNGWMTMAATKFWWHQGAKGTARGLFWASVWHLPILLVLAMALKRGIWARVGESLGYGSAADEDEEFLEETEGPFGNVTTRTPEPESA